MAAINFNKHIWEGWTVRDFINELEPTIDMIMNNKFWQEKFSSKENLKKWCIDNQPCYKKYIPEVVNFFSEKYNIR